MNSSYIRSFIHPYYFKPSAPPLTSSLYFCIYFSFINSLFFPFIHLSCFPTFFPFGCLNKENLFFQDWLFVLFFFCVYNSLPAWEDDNFVYEGNVWLKVFQQKKKPKLTRSTAQTPTCSVQLESDLLPCLIILCICVFSSLCSASATVWRGCRQKVSNRPRAWWVFVKSFSIHKMNAVKLKGSFMSGKKTGKLLQPSPGS